MSEKSFRNGDKVAWKSHGEIVGGSVGEKITRDTRAAGRTVRASKDQPQYQDRSRRRAQTGCITATRLTAEAGNV